MASTSNNLSVNSVNNEINGDVNGVVSVISNKNKNVFSTV